MQRRTVVFWVVTVLGVILVAEVAGAIAKTRRDLVEERILGLVFWRKTDFEGKIEEEIKAFFSEARRPIFESVVGGGGDFIMSGEAEANLQKLALEAELLYGDIERIHDEFQSLLEELRREFIRARLELLSSEIKKLEHEGKNDELKVMISEFSELSRKLTK